jgi:hypothetical protein
MTFTPPKVNEFASSSSLSLISHIGYKNITQSMEEALRKKVTGLHYGSHQGKSGQRDMQNSRSWVSFSV